MELLFGFLSSVLLLSGSVTAQRDDVSQFFYIQFFFLSSYFQEIAFQDNVEDLCEGRPANEYFRLTTEGDCRDVVRCDRAGIAGTIRLASVKCPSGLAFDLERQTCDWKAKVERNEKISKSWYKISFCRLTIVTACPSQDW